MAHPHYTRAEIRAFLQHKYESVPFWTDIEANNALNEALRVWNSLTGYWKRRITIETTAGNFEYALPDTVVFGTRVEFNNNPLTQSSLHDMDNGKPGWQGQTTASGGSVPTSPKIWFPIAIDIIGIWPADAVGENILTVDGISQTPILTSDVDTIDVGNEALGALLGYALHIIALKEGGARFVQTMPYFSDFLREAAEENDQLTQSEMFRHFIGIDMRPQALPTRGRPTDYDEFGGRKA
jgi:hypothetical protein